MQSNKAMLRQRQSLYSRLVHINREAAFPHTGLKSGGAFAKPVSVEYLAVITEK